ncbi:phosphotransferase [candidate division KSB1 bacterium]|nr:phosphotransferase [candidate division KSB1 bacterium]
MYITFVLVAKAKEYPVLDRLKLEKLYLDTFAEAAGQIEPIKGGGSDRRVYRIKTWDRSVIGIAGENRAENEAFIHFSHHFRNKGLPVPEIYATSLSEGVYLEEDLGYYTLIDTISKIRKTKGFSEKIVSLYKKVIEWLPHFQIFAGNTLDYSYCYQHAAFDRDSMLWDLQYFRHRFLEVFYDKEFDRQLLQKDFNTLVQFLLQEKRDYFLYRDFQSRNIMIRNNETWFIDYQSGRRGALQYDIASLLYDAKADIPDQVRQELLTHYLDCLEKNIDVDREKFLTYFYGFVFIRIMQAFGAYGYLATIKGKGHFLRSVPFAIENIERLLQKQTILQRLPTLQKIFTDLTLDKSLRQF